MSAFALLDAYRDGIEDSKQIDVKRRRIEGSWLQSETVVVELEIGI